MANTATVMAQTAVAVVKPPVVVRELFSKRRYKVCCICGSVPYKVLADGTVSLDVYQTQMSSRGNRGRVTFVKGIRRMLAQVAPGVSAMSTRAANG